MPSESAYVCDAHGKRHDFFLSYRVATDSETVNALKNLLVRISKRRFGQSVSVFHDVDCLGDARSWREGFLGALPHSSVILLLVSKGSMQIMKNKIEAKQEDNVVLEIDKSLDLMDGGKAAVLPLCVDTSTEGSFVSFRPYLVPLPATLDFERLNAVLARMNQVQMYGYCPDRPHRRLYRLLSLLRPVTVDPATAAALDAMFFPDSTRLVFTDHLDQLLKTVTLTGRSVVSGMGGMGKSTLARQFLQFMMGKLRACNQDSLDTLARDSVGIKPQYSHVYWVDCSTELAVMESFGRILPGVDKDELKEQTAAFLGATHGYLLVLDNVDDIALANSVFEHSKRHGFGGDVVITTRLPTLPTGNLVAALKLGSPEFVQEPLNLASWPQDITHQYLLSTCPLLARRVTSSGSKELFGNIVSRIGGYPIVIQALAAYVESNDPPLAEMESEFTEALGEGEDDDDSGSRASLTAIVKLSLASLEDREGKPGIAACKLFGAISTVAPTEIPLHLLKGLSANLTSDFSATKLVQLLCRSGLLRRESDDSYSTHSLIQLVAWRYIQSHPSLSFQEIQDTVGRTLLELIKKPFDQRSFALARHLEQYASVASPGAYTKSEDADIERRVGELAYAMGFYGRADRIFASSLNKSIRYFGTRTNQAVADTLHCQGNVALSRGQYDKALTLYQESLSIKTQIYGASGHATIADTLNNIGLVARNQGQFQQSERYLQEALDMYLLVNGTRCHPSVAAALHGLGNLCYSHGQLKKAMDHFQEVLAIEIESLGTRSHPQVADTLNDLGNVASDMGRYAEATAYYEEALEIKIKCHGTRNHPSISETLQNLGIVARSQGQLDLALARSQEALENVVNIQGTRIHSSVADLQCNIGHILHSQGHWESASECFQESLDIHTKVHGTRAHPAAVSAVMGMAQIMTSRGDYAAASRHYEDAIDILHQAFGTKQHPSVVEAIHNIGNLDKLQGRYEQALSRYQEALAIKVELLGTRKHPDIATILMNIGSVESAQGLPALALKHHQEALDIYVAAFGTRIHPDVADVLGAMGNTAFGERDLDGAYKYYQECLDTHVSIHGTRTHLSVATALHNIGSVQNLRGDFGSATECFLEALDIFAKIHGTKTHPSFVNILTSLGNAAKGQHQLDKALGYYQQALAIKRECGTAEDLMASVLLSTMAKIEEDQDQQSEARRYYEESLDVLKTLGALESELAAEVCMGVARLAIQQGRIAAQQRQLEDARAHFERVLRLCAGAFGTQPHPFTAQVLCELALVLEMQGQYQLAAERCQEALSIRKLALGEEHPQVGAVLQQLKSVMDKAARAEPREAGLDKAVPTEASKPEEPEEHEREVQEAHNEPERQEEPEPHEEHEQEYLDEDAVEESTSGWCVVA